MCAEQLDVAMSFPRISVHSGGMERTLKVLEHGERASIHFTALVSPDVLRDQVVLDRLRALARSGRISLQPLGNGGVEIGSYDGLIIPSEFWFPALRRARRAGVQAAPYVEFHQLPYVGTLDVLRSVGVEDPGVLDLVRLPFASAQTLGDSLVFFAFQTVACLASVRALARRRGARVMAVTDVTAKNLRALGYRQDPYVPPVHVGVEGEAIARAGRDDPPVEYDGVYVGRFHPHKGFLDLPLIAAGLRRWKEDVRVAVCGAAQFRRHEAEFHRRVRALGVEENLVLLRWLSQEDLYATVRRSRALLYPSYVDAFSITVLESLCLGIPVVAYAIDALEMIWSRRRGVFTSPVGRPEALAKRFRDLAERGELDDARRLARAQVPELLRDYTWDRVVAFERDFLDDDWT